MSEPQRGESAEAVIWYMRAGNRTWAHSANHEAVGHFERTLGLLDQLRAQNARALT